MWLCGSWLDINTTVTTRHWFHIHPQHLQDPFSKGNRLKTLKQIHGRACSGLWEGLLEHKTVMASRGLRIRDRAKLEFQPRRMGRHRCPWKDAQWCDCRLEKQWRDSREGKPWKCSCLCVDLLHHIRGIEEVWLPKFSWELPPVFSALRSLDLRSSAAAGTFFWRQALTLSSINTHRSDCEVAKKRRRCFAEIKRREPPWPAALRLKWRYGEESSERAFFLTHLRYKLFVSSTHTRTHARWECLQVWLIFLPLQTSYF